MQTVYPVNILYWEEEERDQEEGKNCSFALSVFIRDLLPNVDFFSLCRKFVQSDPQFTNVAAELQVGWVTCPRSHCTKTNAGSLAGMHITTVSGIVSTSLLVWIMRIKAHQPSEERTSGDDCGPAWAPFQAGGCPRMCSQGRSGDEGNVDAVSCWDQAHRRAPWLLLPLFLPCPNGEHPLFPLVPLQRNASPSTGPPPKVLLLSAAFVTSGQSPDLTSWSLISLKPDFLLSHSSHPGPNHHHL